MYGATVLDLRPRWSCREPRAVCDSLTSGGLSWIYCFCRSFVRFAFKISMPVFRRLSHS